MTATRTHTGPRMTVTFEHSEEIPIDVGRERFLHGPAVVRCANGDWLVAYQDSYDDPGRNSFVRQKRSTDDGRTWTDEGPVFDEIRGGYGGRNPAYGLAPDGAVILVVQRVGLKRLGMVHGENIVGSKLLVSRDQGATYDDLGLVDPKLDAGHQGCSTHIVERGGMMYMAPFHDSELPLYVSRDGGVTWPDRTVVVTESEMPESPRYPTVVFRPDGSLLFLGHLNGSTRCFQRVSAPVDPQGRDVRWGPVDIREDIRLRHPVLLYAGGAGEPTLLCLGRDMDVWKTALCVSPDHGVTWSDPIDPVPGRGSGGGYTALWPTGEPGWVLAVFSTDGVSPGAQDIVGMRFGEFTVSDRAP